MNTLESKAVQEISKLTAEILTLAKNVKCTLSNTNINTHINIIIGSTNDNIELVNTIENKAKEVANWSSSLIENFNNMINL